MKTKMTDADVLYHLRENTQLNQFRSMVSGIIAHGEQSMSQGKVLEPLEQRREEFSQAKMLLDRAIELKLVQSFIERD